MAHGPAGGTADPSALQCRTARTESTLIQTHSRGQEIQMKVIEVSAPSDGTTLAMFHQVAASVYRDDPVWVPASEMMFTNRFRDSQAPGTIRMVPVVAVEGDQPVARAVAILSPGARDEAGESQGWIGFFE